MLKTGKKLFNKHGMHNPLQRLMLYSAQAKSTTITLPKDTNQVIGLAEYAQDFLSNPNDKISNIDPSVIDRVEMFHTDSVLCGLSALSLNCNAPTVLRNEALNQYQKPNGATVFGSKQQYIQKKQL